MREKPEVGDAVIYRPTKEYGLVQEIRGKNAMVIYYGDHIAKSTRIEDLEEA